MMFPAPLRLTMEEARPLAEAMLLAEREWGFELPQKWAVLLTLGAVAGGTYKAKLAAFRDAVQEARARAAQAAPPVNQPWRQPPQAAQAAPAGDGRVVAAGGEMILTTGAPDTGRLDFGPLAS